MRLSTFLLIVLMILCLALLVRCAGVIDDCYENIDGHWARVWCEGLPSKGQ